MVPDAAAAFRSGLLAWAEDNLREFPWRNPDASLYDVFVAEFFLTQTPAGNVATVYPEFIEQYPSLAAIRNTDREELVAVIEPIGFQNMRADALLEIASSHETLPQEVNNLTSLPRVGPYVANATSCFALNRPRPLLDRNIVRVYGRAFRDDFPEKEVDRREFAAELLPEDGSTARTYNFALVDFGALVCTKNKPRCDACFASSFCDYLGRQEDG